MKAFQMATMNSFTTYAPTRRLTTMSSAILALYLILPEDGRQGDQMSKKTNPPITMSPQS